MKSHSAMVIHPLVRYNVDIQNVSFISPHQEYNVSYPYVFGFEHEFDAHHYSSMMRTHWRWAYLIAAVYVTVIHSLHAWMKNRPRFELRSILFVWNVCLAVFSVFGSVRAVNEIGYVVSNLGFFHTYCLCGNRFLDNRVGGFWNWMFTLSKVPELGDTVFIVLRKQPLIFLHWYHHVTVLLYAWYSYSDYIATARWFVCMNYLVHSVMYSYYALKALKFKVPRWIAMTITTAQLAQMVMGSAVNIWAYQVKQAGNECHVSYDNIKVSLLMYISYFVLFARFFRRAYVSAPKKALGGSEKGTNGYLANGKSEAKGKVE